jgi:electron transport complex protein RnfB
MSMSNKFSHIAVIREAECIGCAKCIQACPVDAILGSAKYMHTVIADECISCTLCVPVCPVDCIDMLDVRLTPDNETITHKGRERIKARKKRLAQEALADTSIHDNTLLTKKSYVEAALERARIKKMNITK